MSAVRRLENLLDELGLTLPAGAAEITGADPVLDCHYPLGESTAAILAAVGLAAAELCELRGHTAQRVGVDVRHSAALLRGFLDQRVGGQLLDPDPTPRLATVGLFRARDGRWLQVYGGFKPLRERTLDVLGCSDTRAAIAAAVMGRDALELSEALVAAGAPAAVAMTAAEWNEHPQGRALRTLPVVSVEQIGDAAPEPAGRGGRRPLSGVRVLDLSRIVAGPAAARTLGEHGADVLQIVDPRLHAVARAALDTSIGKRVAALQPHSGGGLAQLRRLAGDADVVVQNARPGSFAAKGLGARHVAALRPGIVYVSIDSYGHRGPWASRRGFEPLAQASAGWALDHASADGTPQLVPALACDYATGFVAALGVLVALAHRSKHGGSWHVRASLTRTAMWFADQPGRYDRAAATSLDFHSTRDLRHRTRSEVGATEPLAPPVTLEQTPPIWTRPAVLGAPHEPSFGERADDAAAWVEDWAPRPRAC